MWRLRNTMLLASKWKVEVGGQLRAVVLQSEVGNEAPQAAIQTVIQTRKDPVPYTILVWYVHFL